jgi:hypothetical protein
MNATKGPTRQALSRRLQLFFWGLILRMYELADMPQLQVGHRSHFRAQELQYNEATHYCLSYLMRRNINQCLLAHNIRMSRTNVARL